MGKRIRAQRKGSSPRYRVASHRFPGANRMPRTEGVVGEITELLHSPVHSAWCLAQAFGLPAAAYYLTW